LPFSPQEIQLLLMRPVLIIEETTIKSRFLEPEIAGARERIILSSFQKGTLYRGDLIRLKKYNGHPGYYQHVMVVTNTQWMDDSIALVRVAGYHLSGLPVDPSDETFGTRIFGFPSRCCDVIFPPTLNEFALKATENWPDHFYFIRESAQAKSYM
jgi:hypothetical protein